MSSSKRMFKVLVTGGMSLVTAGSFAWLGAAGCGSGSTTSGGFPTEGPHLADTGPDTGFPTEGPPPLEDSGFPTEGPAVFDSGSDAPDADAADADGS